MMNSLQECRLQASCYRYLEWSRSRIVSFDESTAMRGRARWLSLSRLRSTSCHQSRRESPPRQAARKRWEQVCCRRLATRVCKRRWRWCRLGKARTCEVVADHLEEQVRSKHKGTAATPRELRRVRCASCRLSAGNCDEIRPEMRCEG